MNLRPKTKRRVAVLLLGLAVVLGLATTTVTVRLRRLRTRREAHRIEAMAAYRRGDYLLSAREFDRTLAGSDDTDGPALLADGISHLHLAATDDHQAVTARLMLTRYLLSQPGDLDAEEALLQADRQLGYGTDVLMLGHALLAQNPQDTAALVALVQTLSSAGQYAAAEQTSEALNAVRPADIVAQAATLRLMHLDGTPSARIIARADALLATSPQDPGCLLLRGIAAAEADQPADALRWLHRADAAARPLPSPAVLLLSNTFDHLGDFPDATRLLTRAAADHPADVELRFAWLLREWEQGHTDTLAGQLRGVQPADPQADARLLVLNALGNDAAVNATIKTLQARPTDRLAGVWADILLARSARPPTPPATAMERCRTALVRDEQNAVAVQTLGDVEASVGERDLALQDWEEAAQLAPAWPEPHARRAELLKAEGSFDRADAEAHLALARDPASIPLQQLCVAVRDGPARPVVVENLDALRQRADASPLDAAAQRAVLDSTCCWGDRGLIRRTINRLRRITGDDGVEWRMGQARWLLTSPQNAAASADAAATLMAEVARLAPESPRPLLIWADALQRLGDRSNALARLQAAAALSPGNPAVAARLHAFAAPAATQAM